MLLKEERQLDKIPKGLEAYQNHGNGNIAKTHQSVRITAVLINFSAKKLKLSLLAITDLLKSSYSNLILTCVWRPPPPPTCCPISATPLTFICVLQYRFVFMTPSKHCPHVWPFPLIVCWPWKKEKPQKSKALFHFYLFTCDAKL